MSVGRFRLFQVPQLAGEDEGSQYQIVGADGQLTAIPDQTVLANYYGVPAMRNVSGLFEIGMPPRREARITVGGAYGPNPNPPLAYGWPQPTGIRGTPTGSTAFDTNLAPYQKWETGASASNPAGWDYLSSGGCALRVSYLPQLAATIKTGSNIANTTYWIGGFSLDPTSAAMPSGTEEILGFRFTAGTDTNWQGVCRNFAGGDTVVDLGVAAAADQEIKLMLRVLSSTLVEFWTATTSGWTKRGQITTDLPSDTGALFPLANVFTTTGAARHFYFSDYWLSMR